MPSALPQITNKATHDATLAQLSPPDSLTLILYITSPSLPSCRATQPHVELLSQHFASDPSYTSANGKPKVKVYEMEITKDTQPMIKFSAHNCPIFIVMGGGGQGERGWCETLLGGGEKGVADVRRVVDGRLGVGG